jgi:HlyD family secretion protein
MSIKNIIWNKFTAILLLLALGAGGYFYWNKNQQKTEQARYRTVKVESGDVTQAVSANGTLNPVVLVSVGTQVSGTVKKLHADFNDKVEKGQVLVELDASLFEAQARQSEANIVNARASLELAQANQARMQNLYVQEYISKQELDQTVQALKSSRAQLDLAQAQWQKDKTNLGYTVIRAPVSGVVVSREVDVGQTVAASFQTPTLFKIAQDLGQMQIDSSFAEADIGKIQVGQSVRFTVDAFSGRTFVGKVKQVRLNPTTQQNVVTYDVVVSVDNPELILLPGMTAYVSIEVAKRNNAVLIPNAALRFHPKEVDATGQPRKRKKTDHAGFNATVYVLENGLAKAVRIQTGITDSKMTEVTAGDLKPGSNVIVEDTRDSAGAAAGAQGGSGNMRMRMF